MDVAVQQAPSPPKWAVVRDATGKRVWAKVSASPEDNELAPEVAKRRRLDELPAHAVTRTVARLARRGAGATARPGGATRTS